MINVERESGFNDHSERVEISAQDRAIGSKSYDYFKNKLIRPLPWDIKNGKITIRKMFDAHAEVVKIPGEKYVADVAERRVIITDRLEKEYISPTLARLITGFKMVEDSLPDYMGRSTKFTRNIMGLNMSYNQWGREELQHSLALGLILEKTGNKTSEEIKNEYNANLAYRWEPPFPTIREMVIYSTFQEVNTGENYKGLRAQALREDAPIVAQILQLIEEDERYHGGGYRGFTKLFYEQDPAGTQADAIHVAKNFQMPIGNFLNKRQAFTDLVRVGAYTRETLALKTIQSTLRGFEFIPEPQIQEVVAGYLK